MSAREDILGAVRRATAAAEPVARPAPVPGRHPDQWTLELFVERVADYRATVERCGAGQVAERVAAAVAGLRVVVPDGLSVEVPGATRDDGLSAVDLDQIQAVVTDAAVGVAETGTIVLDHGAGQGRRALTLVPDKHVCIVTADRVVADVPDAFPRLDPGRPLTWISGPSATSDIELVRVEGVHGPRNLHVVVVEPGPQPAARTVTQTGTSSTAPTA